MLRLPFRSSLRFVFAYTPLTLSIALGLGAAPAYAPGPAVAGPVQIRITAQPLAQALIEVARQARLELMVQPALVAGKNAPAVAGYFTPQQALQRLLAGSGLEGRVDGSVLLVRPQPVLPGATLPAVTVLAEAARETATGPVSGYVAKRSAAASKTDTPLRETARSISVVTADQIEAQAPRSVTETLGYTPGVTATSYAFSVTDAEMYLRGFALETNSSIYLDGMRIASSALYNRTAAEPYGLERVEVLRGPASVLYGRNEPGGVVNLVSKLPSTDPIHEIKLSAGSFGRQQLALDLSDAIDADGVWSYRLTALDRSGNSQVENASDKRSYIAPSLTWHPSARTKLTLLAQHQRNQGLSNNALPAEGTVLYNPNGQLPTSRNAGSAQDNHETYTKNTIGYILEQQLSDTWQFRQNLRYSDFDGYRSSIRGGGYQAGQLRVIDRSIWQLASTGNTFTLDNQFQSQWKQDGMEHTVLLGLDYIRGKGTVTGAIGATSPLDLYAPNFTNTPLLDTNYSRRSSDAQTGFYAQDTVKIAEKWVLSLGGRRDFSTIRQVGLLDGSSDTAKYQANSGQAGLVYLADNGLAPYVSYARSFKPVSGTDASGALFKPERGTQYEVGVKYEPAGYNALLTLAAFDLRRTNVTTSDIDNPGFDVQRGEVRSRGLELEAKAALTPRLSLIGGYTYTDVRVTKSNDDTQGKSFPEVPRHMASLWADYQLGGIFAGLRLAGGLRLVGSSYGDYVESFKVPGYSLLDLAARYDLQQLNPAWRGAELGLNVQNLGDKRYASCEDITSCEFGSRRNVLLSLAYRW